MLFLPLALLIVSQTCLTFKVEPNARAEDREINEAPDSDPLPPAAGKQEAVDENDGRNNETVAPCHRYKIEKLRDDYIYSAVGAHKLHTYGANWDDARKTCIEEGAQLAVINSALEAEWLRSILVKAAGKITNAEFAAGAWFGYHDLFRSREFVTITGASFASTGYTDWRIGQPDNVEQRCIFWYEGEPGNPGFDDGTCTALLAFFCELEA